MAHVFTAVLVDDERLSTEEITFSCTVDHAWLVEHVQAGVLSPEPGSDMAAWRFSGADVKRVRRLLELERNFAACPELAGLVVDLLEEIERVKTRLRRAGVSTD